MGRRSVKTNAIPHEGAIWLLSLDLKDFFDNIYANRVYEYFSGLGYEKKSVGHLLQYAHIEAIFLKEHQQVLTCRIFCRKEWMMR